MTTPDISDIVPLKYKAWVGLFGSLLTLVVPAALDATSTLDQPWPTVIGLVVALLTTLGIYKAPYKPTGTTLAIDPRTPVIDLPAVEEVLAPPPVATTNPAAVADQVPTEESTPDDDSDYYPSPWK